VPAFRRTNGYWYVYIEPRHGKQLRKSLKSKRKPSAREISRVENELWERAESRPKAATMKPVERGSSLEQIIKAYSDWVYARQTERSAHGIRAALLLACESIGARSIQGWTFEALEKFMYDHQRERGWAAATFNRYASALRTFLSWCQVRGIIDDNPAQKLTPMAKKRKLPRWLTMAQIEDVINACRKYDEYLASVNRPVWVEDFVRIAMGTGMRITEMVNLLWADVDMINSIITVRQGKGGKDRAIPISDKVRAVLEAMDQSQEKVLPHLGYKSNRAVRRALKNAGITPFGPHVFRHTFASHLVMEGVDLRTVADLMGHSTEATTEGYAHLSPRHISSVRDRMKL